MNKIFISTTSFAQYSNETIDLLDSQNISYKINDKGRKISDAEVPIMLADCEGVIAGTETYSKENLKKLPHLNVVSRVGVGLDNIDLDFANKRNIKIYKTQTNPAPAVAELTLGLILDILRKISNQNHILKNGIWEKQMGSLLYGKTLGIIGLGTIGKKLVGILQGFKLQYLAYDIKQDIEFAEKYNIKYCQLSDLLFESDVVTIHLNLSKETNNLMDYDALKKMKSDAILINTSRGEIIDETALVQALDKELIAGAGLDVFEQEPYSGPLAKLDNVILTPHVGAYAKEIRMQMEIEAAENLIKGLNNI